MPRNIHTSIGVAAGVVILAVILGGITGSVLRSTPMTTFSVAPSTQTQMVFEHGFAPVVQKAAPAVVNISSSKIVKATAAPQLPFSDDLLRRFFGRDFGQFGVPRERRERSLGSGVIVNSSGYVLTNNHVVENANEVTVALSDAREVTAKIVGTDPGTDIAVLKIDAGNLTSLPFADSSKVQVGDLALAIGDPFGVGRTVTMGIVSATGRGGLGIEDYEDFIQTDASINPGNSGGALTNVNGELIGINTAILSPSGGNLGIGFAVPSNMVRSVMDQIVRTGKVTRGYMGVLLQDVTPEIAEAMRLGQTRGALVSEVEHGSPAERAGLQPGDVIVEAAGKPVTDRRAVQLLVASMAPGSQISMRVQHNGSSRNVTLTLAEAPREQEAAAAQQSSNPERGQPRLGISITDLTPQIRQQLNLPSTITGVVVGDVQEGSPAAEAGLRPGDVIQELNGKPVQSAEEFRTQVGNAGSGAVLLRISREGHSLFLAIK